MILNEDVIAWFDKKDWRQSWEVAPHPSLDVTNFSLSFFAKEALWQRAFAFLRDSDLLSLETGIHRIEGSDLFAIVQEYVTLEESETRYEAHRRYADIQYVIAGSERIGIVPLEDTIEVTRYDEEKDLVFLEAPSDVYHSATAEHFFVFLPSDAHRPCVMIKERGKVRKIVVKVRL